MHLTGQQILVTGATGFIGGRVVEVLMRRHGCRVRALVHDFTNASRLARFPVEMLPGDISDETAVARAAQGCDVIIHAAVGNAGTASQNRQTTVRGTEAVLKAGLAAGVGRVVHLSTISVYGWTPDGDLTENSSPGRLFDEYCRDKNAAEKLALYYHRKKGLPVTVLQPTVVYGPFSRPWTVGPLKQLQNMQVVLPDEGRGFCNAVYIDDVVDAIVRAASVREAVGERFLISGAKPVTWRDFYGAYEDMLGLRSTISMTEPELRKELRGHPWRDLLRDCVSFIQHPKVNHRIQSTFLLRTPYETLRHILPRRWRDKLKGAASGPALSGPTTASKPKRLPHVAFFRWLAARTHVRIDKARQLLGYAPQFDFEAGMLRTRLWAEWAALLN
jgi:nucleoside-diphosphate-sugar epimerase